MRQDWFVAAVLCASTLAMAQQPKVVNAQMHTESAGEGLSATVNRMQHTSGPLADLATICSSDVGRVVEMEANEDTRIAVLIGGLGEAGVRARHRCRTVAGAGIRKPRAVAILEADLIAAEHLFQHLRSDPAFDRVARWVVLIRRCPTQRRPRCVTGAAVDRGNRPKYPCRRRIRYRDR